MMGLRIRDPPAVIIAQQVPDVDCSSQHTDNYLQWLEQTEPKIASQELAKDAQATQHLLNQHKALAEDFDNQNSKIKELEAKAEELDKSNNFKAKDLKNQVEEIREKYDSLAPVLENRGQVLKKSLADYELLHDINEHRIGLNNFEIEVEYLTKSKSKN